MIATYGLTHLDLEVRDPDRSMRFYEAVFGLKEYFRDALSIHASTPGCKDVITFVRNEENAGRSGGIAHFGFRLVAASDIDVAVEQALAAGGTLLRRGEFQPGFPYAYIADPDGYEVEIWFE